MTTAEVTWDIGSIDAATGALSRLAELERAVRKAAVLKRVSGVLRLVQLENLTCEVEDIGETAALSSSPEIRASIMNQLTAHGIVSADDL